MSCIKRGKKKRLLLKAGSSVKPTLYVSLALLSDFQLLLMFTGAGEFSLAT